MIAVYGRQIIKKFLKILVFRALSIFVELSLIQIQKTRYRDETLLTICIDYCEPLDDRDLIATLLSIATLRIDCIQVLLCCKTKNINFPKISQKFPKLNIVYVLTSLGFCESLQDQDFIEKVAGKYLLCLRAGSIISPNLKRLLFSNRFNLDNIKAIELDEIELDIRGTVTKVWLSRSKWSLIEKNHLLEYCGSLIYSVAYLRSSFSTGITKSGIVGLQGCWVTLTKEVFSKNILQNQQSSRVLMPLSKSMLNLSVSIVIPTIRTMNSEGCSFILRLLSNLSAQQNVDLELLIVDGGANASCFYKNFLEGTFKSFKIIPFSADDKCFNFSAKVNAGVSEATNEIIVLLNDDLLAATPLALHQLVSSLGNDNIAIVGAKLCFPDGRLQHVGVITGLARAPFHQRHGMLITDFRLREWLSGPRNVSAVTGAVMATKKSHWQLMGGFDNQLAIEFNDIDFCLRSRAAGYKVLYEGRSSFIHHEKSSRNIIDYSANILRERKYFKSRWSNLFVKNKLPQDPDFHPWLNKYDIHQLMPNWFITAQIEYYCKKIKRQAIILEKEIILAS